MPIEEIIQTLHEIISDQEDNIQHGDEVEIEQRKKNISALNYVIKHLEEYSLYYKKGKQNEVI